MINKKHGQGTHCTKMGADTLAHGLRTPRENFFQKSRSFWLGQTFSTEIIQLLFLQKTKPLYIYLGVGFELGPQIIWELAFVCPYSVFCRCQKNNLEGLSLTMFYVLILIQSQPVKVFFFRFGIIVYYNSKWNLMTHCGHTVHRSWMKQALYSCKALFK